MTTQTLTYRCPHCHQNVEVELHPENEMLVCPNEACKKPFKVDVPTAEPVSELAAAPRPQRTAPPTSATAKPLAEAEKEAPEVVLGTVSLSMFRRYPLRCALYFLLIAGTAVGAVLYMLWENTFGAFVCLVVCAVVACRFCIWWWRMRNTLLKITDRRCILQRGVFHKESLELPLDDIQDIQINQTWLQRVLGVGDLILVSKRGDAHRVMIMAVRSPQVVAKTLQEHQHAVKK